MTNPTYNPLSKIDAHRTLVEHHCFPTRHELVVNDKFCKPGPFNAIDFATSRGFGEKIAWEIRKATTALKVVACDAFFNSKDPSSKVGAMIVRPDFSRVSTGYNGMPKGIPDDDAHWHPDVKYDFSQHAEKNAVGFSHGVDTDGCYLICNLYPCHVCAGIISQAGISKIFYSADKRPGTAAYVSHKPEVADEIFDAANIKRIQIPGIVFVASDITFKPSAWDAIREAE